MSDITNIPDATIRNAQTPRNATMPETQSNSVLSILLAQNWWVVLLRGMLGIAFGLVAIMMPGVTLLSLTLVFSVYMLVDGVLAITMAIREARHGERWLTLALEGLLRIGVAILAYVWPLLTILAFVYIVAFWSIMSGAMMVAASFKLHETYGRIWMGVGGVLSVLFGLLLVAAPPMGALIMTFWIGIYATIFGAAMVMLAFQLRIHRNDHLTGTTPVTA